MSQLVNRNGSTPIPINIFEKTDRASSLNTGYVYVRDSSREQLAHREPRKYPVLPHDLASDIQQFAESQFARQYFSTHRTGFIFKRTVPVTEIMTWQKVRLLTYASCMRRLLIANHSHRLRLPRHC